jgi:uncharacterized protein
MVSPRGDSAGFVRILDERTLLIPDRPGNRIADTLTNVLESRRIALLFLAQHAPRVKVSAAVASLELPAP